jgi:hypothetical protein
MQKLRPTKWLIMASCLWTWVTKVLVSSILYTLLLHLGNDEKGFFDSYKPLYFYVGYNNSIWNSKTLLSRILGAFLDLTYDSSWVIKYYSDSFSLHRSCHSRSRVSLQCHCQLKLKTKERCNDAEQKANIISFSSKKHQHISNSVSAVRVT